MFSSRFLTCLVLGSSMAFASADRALSQDERAEEVQSVDDAVTLPWELGTTDRSQVATLAAAKFRYYMSQWTIYATPTFRSTGLSVSIPAYNRIGTRRDWEVIITTRMERGRTVYYFGDVR